MLYASHIYDGVALDVVAVDLFSGEATVFSTISAEQPEYGAWAMVTGADGQGKQHACFLLRAVVWSKGQKLGVGPQFTLARFHTRTSCGSTGRRRR